jgi:hypothetical protein
MRSKKKQREISHRDEVVKNEKKIYDEINQVVFFML